MTMEKYPPVPRGTGALLGERSPAPAREVAEQVAEAVLNEQMTPVEGVQSLQIE
jgi:hypothetical protein